MKSAKDISLRRKAEQLLKNKQAATAAEHMSGTEPSRSEADTIKLLHEFEVHQIELEIQNEELQQAKEKAETNAEKYASLYEGIYEFAPAAYFTLDKDCAICELNLNGAKMLGKERSNLNGSHFNLFVSQDSHILFISFLDKISETKTKQSCEVRLTINEKATILVHMEGFFLEAEQKYRLTVVDVSEQKKVEKKLYQREQEFRTLVENAPDIIFRFDRSLRHTYVNAAVEKAAGIPKQAYIGKDHRELGMPEESVNLFQKHIRNVFESGQIEVFQFSFPSPIGEQYFESRYVPEFAKDGTVEHVMGITRDITELKLVEKELLLAKDRAVENEEKLSSYIDNAPDGVFVTDENGCYLEINSASEKITGYSKAELLTMSASQITPPEEGEYGEVSFAEVKETGSSSTEGLFLHKSGQKRWWSVDSVKLSENRYLGFVKDITDRKHAETKLKDSNERFNLAMESTSDGLWDWDLNTNEIYYSSRWKSMLGYADSELVNDFSVWDKLTTDEDVKNSWDMLNKHIAGEIDKFEMEFKMQHKDGHWVDISSRATAFRNEQGKAYRIVGLHTDITESKKAKLQLQKSDDRFRKLIDNMPSGVAIYKAVDNGTDFEFIDLNKKAEEITKVSKKEVIGHTLLETFPNMKNGLFVNALKKISKDGISINLPPFFYKDDQRQGWRENNIYKLASGEIVAIFKDVTAIKEVEEQLKLKNLALLNAKVKAEENENKLIEISDNLEAHLWTFNGAEYTYFNKNWYDYTGQSNSENPTIESWTLTVHPDDLEKSTKIWLENFENKTEHDNFFRLKRFDGVYRDYHCHAIPIFDKNQKFKHFLGFNIDVTERKQGEEALKESEEKANQISTRLSLSIDNMPTAFILWDNNLRAIEWNKAAETIFGFSRQEMIGNTPVDYIVPEEVRPIIVEVMKKLNVGETADYSAKNNNINKNGALISCRWFNTPLIDNSGKVIAIQSLALDITKQLTAEEKIRTNEVFLKEKNQEYKNVNSELLKTQNELIISKEKAEQSDILKSAFLTNMSHEIRTPLNAVLGFSQLLTKSELDIKEKITFSEYIRLNGESLAKIIDDIIDISKLQSKQLTIRKRAFNLHTIFEELNNYYSSLLIQKAKSHIKLIVELPNLLGANFYINTDEQRLKQILNNLISNAIKFTSKGSITFGYRLLENKLDFFVKDTGIGIGSKNLPQIFERFTQFSSQYVSKQEGTGLGLSISKNLVALLGGELQVESKESKGSLFHFQIPFVKAEQPTRRKANSKIPLNKDLSKYKILIADDEDSNYVLTKRILKSTKVITDWAQNGKHAVEMAANNNYDLILMDIKMPEMDGIEATRLIKTHNNNIPIIMQTAFAMKKIKDEAEEAGCDDFIVKPIGLDAFLELVNKHIK